MKFIVIACMLLYVSATAQPSACLIRCGKLFDSEKGIFIPGMVILVSGQMIDSVMKEKDLTDLDRQKYPVIVDLSNSTVTPGLIDSHTHLLYQEIIYPVRHPGSLDLLRELELESDAYRALRGAAKAKAYLENGITIVQDLGNSGQFADMALKRAIRNQLLPGPDMSCSGPGLAAEGAQLPGLVQKHQDLVSNEYRIVKGVEDAMQAVRENVNQGANVIKIYADNAPNVPSLNLEEISSITKEAHRYNRKITAHAGGNQAVWTAVMGGVNSIEHGYQMDDSTMQLMAAKKVEWVATYGDTMMAAKARALSRPDLSAADIKKAVYRSFQNDSAMLQRGIRNRLTVICGSDDYLEIKIPAGEATKHVLIGYVEKGMTIAAALQTATLNATRHIGMKGVTGKLAKGQPANIAAFGINLPVDIHELLKTVFVMKNGTVYLDKSK